jgi:hypothetical protein
METSMSRKLFAFLLSELKIVRINCPRPECRSVTEVSLERLRSKFATPSCPVCNHELLLPFSGSENALTRLAKAMEDLQANGVAKVVEFVLPDEGEK